MAEEINLRDYQETMVGGVSLALRKHRRVLLQSSTGSGKTVVGSHFTRSCQRAGRRLNFNVHRVELVDSTSRTFGKYGIPHGFIAANRDPLAGAIINVCAIDTLKNRLHTTPEPDFAIWDECHHLGAAGWRMVMDAWKRCRHIGLSATPWRLDGSGLDDCFDDLVLGPSTAWLIEQGHLSRFEVFAPFVPNMKGVRKQGGDFGNAEASARMDIPKRTGDIIKHWRKHANGLRTMAFALNVADSLQIVQAFNSVGIPAAHLDGKTSDTVRRDVIRDFALGKIKVLSNVALFDEGFDLAAIAQMDVTVDCLIDAAPTQSLSRVLQRWGRVLRPKDHPAIILDHAGNTLRHGFPDDDREWSLEGREKSGSGGKEEGPPPPVTCEGCYRQIKRPLPPCCPTCGKSLQAPVKEVEVVEGELRKLTAEDKAAINRARKLEEHNAKTLPELLALAHRRGYKDANMWALKKWANSPERQRIHKKTQDSLA